MITRIVAWFSSILSIVLIVVLLSGSNTPQKPAAVAPPRPPGASRPQLPPVHLPPALSPDEAREVATRDSESLRDKVTVAVQKRIRQRAVERSYGYVFSQLAHLDVRTRQRVREVLGEKMLAISDAKNAAINLGITPDSDAFAQAISQATAEHDAQLQEVLGSDYTKFQQLEKLSGSMQIVENVMAVNMAASDVPLSAEQRLALATLMTDIHYSFGDPEYAKRLREPPRPASGLSPLNEELLRRASTVLTPEQLAVLRDYQSEQTLAIDRGAMPPRL